MNGILQSAVDVCTAIAQLKLPYCLMGGIAALDQDWIDIRGILVRHRIGIDRDLIFEELIPLAKLKEEPEILTRLNDPFQSTSRI